MGIVRSFVFVQVFVWHPRLVSRVRVAVKRWHWQRRDIHLRGCSAWIGTNLIVGEQIVLGLVADALFPTTFLCFGRLAALPNSGGKTQDESGASESSEHESPPCDCLTLLRTLRLARALRRRILSTSYQLSGGGSNLVSHARWVAARTDARLVGSLGIGVGRFGF